MNKELYQEIKIPEGVEVELDGSLVKVKGSEGEFERRFTLAKLELKKEGENIIIGYGKSTKREKKLMNSIAAHIRNMIKGVQEKFEYKLKVCSSHFPMSVEIKDTAAEIKNFLGEKIARKVRIPKGVEVNLEKDIITIKSNNKELAGQAAANFESVTKVGKKDRRVFQDGIFIINKSGKEI
ncbi:MAG: 50S ribosomal protein L6 [Candidatus Pacearchaeota archaeon]